MKSLMICTTGAMLLTGCKPLELTLFPVCVPAPAFAAAIARTCFNLQARTAGAGYSVDAYSCGDDAIAAINLPEGKVCFSTNGPPPRNNPPAALGVNPEGEGDA